MSCKTIMISIFFYENTFLVWDGYHYLQTQIPIINQYHLYDFIWYYVVESINLDDKILFKILQLCNQSYMNSIGKLLMFFIIYFSIQYNIHFILPWIKNSCFDNFYSYIFMYSKCWWTTTIIFQNIISKRTLLHLMSHRSHNIKFGSIETCNEVLY